RVAGVERAPAHDHSGVAVQVDRWHRRRFQTHPVQRLWREGPEAAEGFVFGIGSGVLGAGGQQQERLHRGCGPAHVNAAVAATPAQKKVTRLPIATPASAAPRPRNRWRVVARSPQMPMTTAAMAGTKVTMPSRAHTSAAIARVLERGGGV